VDADFAGGRRCNVRDGWAIDVVSTTRGMPAAFTLLLMVSRRMAIRRDCLTRDTTTIVNGSIATSGIPYPEARRAPPVFGLDRVSRNPDVHANPM